MSRSIYVFIVVSFLISWTIWILMLLSNKGLIGIDIPRVTHFSTAIGPLIGAMAGAILAPKNSVKRLFQGLFKFKVPFKWYLYSIAIPFIGYGVAATITSIIDPDPEYGFNNVINTIAILITMPFIVFGEEIGWRGFALTELNQRYSNLKSSLIIGIMWSIWHLPAFFVADIFESNFQLAGAFIGFIVLCMVLSILFTWVVNSSGGSTFLAVLMHAAVASASSLTNIALKAPISFFVLFTLVFLVMAFFVIGKWKDDPKSAGTEHPGLA